MKMIIEHRTSEILDGNIPVKDVPIEELNDMENTARKLLQRIRELIRKKLRYNKLEEDAGHSERDSS